MGVFVCLVKKTFFFERFVIRWGKFMSKSVFCLSKKDCFVKLDVLEFWV